MFFVRVWRWLHVFFYHVAFRRCCDSTFLGEFGVWQIDAPIASNTADGAVAEETARVGYEGYCCDTCGYVRLSGAQFDTADLVDTTIRCENKHGIAPWTR